MFVKRDISWKILLRFAWAYVLFYAFWGSLVVIVFHELEHLNGRNIAIPFLPVSTIGIAVAFYVGFKNNQSYDRFWEARKIWGGIVNYSRTWGNQVLSFITTRHAPGEISDNEVKDIQQRLIYRHIAWLNALTLHLRRPSSFSKKYTGTLANLSNGNTEFKHWQENLGPFLTKEEFDNYCSVKNIPTQLIRKQGDELRILMEEKGLIEDFRHMEMMRVLEEFYNLQGKCERIKNTPFPRQYSYFSKLFIWIFVLILPLGLIGQFAEIGHGYDWLMVPFYVLISWIFMTMELVGDNSEDPFEGFINDVPMTALSRTIEIDLREMLGETDLPPKTEPVNDILL